VNRQIRQLEFNAPNLPIYVKFTASFIGDYIDVAARQFVPNPGDPNVPFKFNISPNQRETFHTTWTDNRDVRAPADGNWAGYTPVKKLSPDGTAVVSNLAACVPGKENVKNQNVYTARIGEGLNAFAVVNSKLLNGTPRRFSLVLQNNTPTTQNYTLDGAGQASGAMVTFDQTGQVGSLSVKVAGYSSASRTAWVTAGNPKARVEIAVKDALGSPVSTIVLNPDPAGTFVTNTTGGGDLVNNDMTELTGDAIRNNELTNNELTNNELTNNELTNNELTNNELTNNELTNNELTNNELTNNELTNNELTNNELTNTALTNNELTNNELTNNELTNNELTNNELTNNELTNGSLADATFVVTNKGNTDGVLNVKSIIKGSSGQTLPPGYIMQLVVHKLYRTPEARGCSLAWRNQEVVLANIARPAPVAVDGNLGTPSLSPEEWNASVPMAVNDVVRVTYRILSKSGSPLTAKDFAAVSVKTVAVGPDGTIVPVPLLIQPADIPAGAYESAFSYQVKASGGAAGAVQDWTGTTGLPTGLTINAQTGFISGTPTVAGTFPVLAKVTAGGQTDIQKFSLTVNKIPLTITAGSGSRVYGLANPAITPSYSMALGSETIAGLVCGTAATQLSPVGNYATVCSGGESGGFEITYAPGILSVTPAPLTITAGNASRVYGAATNPTISASFAGLVGSDTVAGLVCTSAANASSAVGEYPTTCSGGVAGNYTITYVPGKLTVTPAPLTITAGSVSRQYGVATNPAIPPLFGGLIYADTVAAVSCFSAADASSPVGEYPTTCSGAVAGNYTITYVAGKLTVVAAPLAVLAVDATAVYGAAIPPLTFTYVGPAGIFTTLPNCGTTASAGSPAGAYPIACANGVAPNYSLTYSVGQLSIIPTALTITANNASSIVGAPLPALTATFAGFIPGDTAAKLTGTVVCVTTATPASVPGSYPITCSGASSSNYTITYAPGVLTLNPVPVSVVAGPTLLTTRSNHTATTLADGTVLITGGSDSKGPLNSAETYDPVTGTVTAVQGGTKNKVSGHTATLLMNGKVLIAGGGNSSGELYDPAKRSFSSLGGLSQRSFHTATRLQDGRVLLAGGGTQTVMLYNPATAAFASTGSMSTARQRHTAVLLASGKVLILGGLSGSGAHLNSAEIYDPATGAFTTIAPMKTARSSHSAVVLADQTVLVMGGANTAGTLGSTEIFNPVTQAFSDGPALTARQSFTADRRQDNLVLVIGGANGTAKVGSTQIYSGSGFVAGPGMLTPRSGHASAVLANGSILVTGGLNASGAPVKTTEVYK
jgi:hypothetical protein